jgi:hypothetical protein
MATMKSTHCLSEMADALEVSKSGFHAHQRKPERPKAPRGQSAVERDRAAL